jgi:cytochrome subunit of sulfide dehydrogenase
MRVAAVLAGVLVVLPLAAHSQQNTARNLAAACAICHGTDGRSAGGAETLAGAPKDDFVRKMNEFRSGAKPATVMHQIAKGYTDAEIAAMADYFAAQPPKR